MSHFSRVETKLFNLDVLKRTLSNLSLEWSEKIDYVKGYKDQTEDVELVIKQSNNYDIGFKWNGAEYELVSDLMFWDQQYSVEKFLNRVSQRYAYELLTKIHSESDYNINIKEDKAEVKDPNIYINLTKYIS